MNSPLHETGLPEGVKWTPKTVRRSGAKAAKKKEMSLNEMNKRLAATRRKRLADAEENCEKLTGKRSF